MLALPNCRSFLNLHPPASAKTTRSRARSSMEPSASRPAVAGFPYLLPAHRELMMDLISSIEARLGPTALLPSSVPADVLYFENQAGTSQGALDIRSGAPDSSVDFILESWLHCQVPSGDLNITTVLGFLNASTDAPHLMMDVIQGSPTSLILLMDLLPRRDPVLHPEYLEFYESTHLDKLRRDLEQLPQVSPYRSPSLYIRSILSPTAIAVSIDCRSEGEGCMEETLGVHISRAAKGIVEVWMDKCAEGGSIDLEEGTRAEMLKRDELIKSKAVEIDLAANLPRLFGPDIANKIVGEVQKAYRLVS